MALHRSHWKREFNHAQRLRPAVKPTARAPPRPAHRSEQRKGPEPGAAEATRRHKAPSEPRDGVEAEHSSPRSAPIGPREIVKAADTPTPGRHSSRVTQAGEDSAGGARRPELGKPSSRPPGQSSKPPKC